MCFPVFPNPVDTARGRFLRAPLVAGLLVLLVAPAPAASCADAWVRGEAEDGPRLSLEQSLASLDGLPRRASEWTLAEKLAAVAEAGFDGVSVPLDEDPSRLEVVRELARRHGLALSAQCALRSVHEVEDALSTAKDLGARALSIAMGPVATTQRGGFVALGTATIAGDRAGIPIYVSAKRGSITQDLLLTAGWASAVPGMRIDADLAEYVVGYGLDEGGDPRIEEAIRAILGRTGMLRGRIASAGQVQVDVGPRGETKDAARFATWWKKAMATWLESAGPGDVFVFRCDVRGPPAAVVDAEGRETSDRWAQALVIRDLAVSAWNEAVEGTGHGTPYEVGAGRAGEVTTPGPTPPGKWPAALQPEVSGIYALRGECVKLGDVYLSGQLGQPAFEVARQKGIKTVLNVRMAGELGGLGYELDATVKDLGLTYVDLPVAPENMDDARAEKFLEILRTAEKPLLVNGSNGNRVWGLWALWMGVQHGVPVEETRRVAAEWEVKKLVIDDFVTDFLQRRRKDR